MIDLVACPEASRLDSATADRAAIPPLILMEDASLRIWQALEPLARPRGAGASRPLVALCGPGNNGGDALATLRHARFAGFLKLSAILAKGPGELAAVYASSLKALGVEILDWSSGEEACLRRIGEASLILDGLSGSGLAGAIREPSRSILEAANAAAKAGTAALAAVDLPSGLSDSFDLGWPMADCAWTLSVEPRKACLYFPLARERCGTIVPVEGVFPADAEVSPEAELLAGEDLDCLVPRHEASAYKGSRGRVAVFAGAEGTSGAAVLASRACLAAGAGIASLFSSRELYPIAAPMLQAVMVKREPSDLGTFEASRYDALLIGPGWGRSPERRKQLGQLLASGAPAVLDADAIYLLRELSEAGFTPRGPLILTPHPGEFAALTGTDPEKVLAAPADPLARAARAFGAVVVLKSHVTWIASPSGELAVWDGREPGLGTAGSGDVLAGLTSGLLASLEAGASKPSPGTRADWGPAFRAARAGVIAHGLAGRRAREARGWFEAGDLLAEAAAVLGKR